MSALAIALLAVGVADLVGLHAWQQARRAVLVATLSGWSTIAVLAVLVGATSGADVVLLLLAAVTVGGWVLTTAEDAKASPAVALAILTGGFVALLLGSGAATDVGGSFVTWLEWTGLRSSVGESDPGDVLLIAGLLLVQISTANTVVRLVLTQMGALGPAGQAQASDRLRGGRILGPMERLIIVGLGLAGEVTAASLVIAAKGLIRWPELRQSDLADPDAVGVDEVTEYFLVGSMLSWILALLALAAARLLVG